MKTKFLLSIFSLALAASSPVAASVLLTNGSFETTGAGLGSGLFAVSGWTNLSGLAIQASSAPSGFESTPTGQVTGSRYLRLATDNQTLIGDILQNTGTLNAGHTYTLTASIFAGTSSLTTGFGVTMLFTDNVGATYASSTYSGLATGLFTTGSLSYTASLADEGKPLYVELRSLVLPLGTASRGGVDNLILTDSSSIPEPGTFALLAFPLLAILKRRAIFRC